MLGQRAATAAVPASLPLLLGALFPFRGAPRGLGRIRPSQSELLTLRGSELLALVLPQALLEPLDLQIPLLQLLLQVRASQRQQHASVLSGLACGLVLLALLQQLT